MPKLTIDGVEVEVPEGTNVLEAAKKVGVVIPHFCYHPALGSVGACRLCAMKFIAGPVKGVQVSCMVKAADGMVVSTTDGDAARLRSHVIEWLMENHPHDCPVCDEGGMCLLQDYTIAGGHGIRRYKGKKRTFPDQYLGEFIQQEMNRCIQCYRCVRFYQDYAGGDDFGTMQITNKTFFGRFREGWLESEFHGNLADVCPTGVFTDKTYRYRARPWALQTAPSVCPHCSLGCNVVPGARYRELLRVEARENPDVNGWFICDRGRFGYRFAGRPDRPYFPVFKGANVEREHAVRETASILAGIIEKHGPDSVAFMGSVRTSIENNFTLTRLASAMGSKNVCFSCDPAREKKDRHAASVLGGNTRSLRDVEFSDFIAGVGIDPINEAPMLALLMRQAVRKGAGVVIIDPRPVKLPFAFKHLPAAPDELADALSGTLQDIAAKKPTVIVGTDVGGIGLIDRAGEEVNRLRSTGIDCGLSFALAGANSFGAAIAAGDGGDFEDILKGMEEGRIKALVIVESDPLGRYPDRGRAARAFSGLETLIVMDYVNTETVRRAGVFLPSTAYAEMDGTSVNQEGRAQAFARAYIPGTPVNRMGPAPHPPREFRPDVPGRAIPAWQWLEEMAAVFDKGFLIHGSASDIRQDMAHDYPVYEPLAALHPEDKGARLYPAHKYTAGPGDIGAGAGMTLLVVDLTFGTEELSQYSDKTQLRAPEPYVLINTGDAAGLGLDEGDAVVIASGGKEIKCTLMTSDKSAKGVAIAPRLLDFPVGEFSGRKVTLKKAR